jgi:predicted transcriptional regulator of viral defense system
MREFPGTPPDWRVAELAARQWGVVSVAQLQALGLGKDAVQRRVRAGRLHRLHQGVYAVGHTVLRREGRWLAAVLACGKGAVLSHRSAAAHWGLLQTQATRIDVTAPRTRAGNARIRLHRSRSLIACDTTTHQGIPTTSIPRTLLDLAATVKPDRLERALAQAEHLELYDHRAITELLARANGHRGKGALTEATPSSPSSPGASGKTAS